MPRGGVRPGSGRPKGSATKRTREIADKALASGLTPLEFMLELLRDEANDRLTRFEAAKAAAPYVHAKLASTEIKGDPESPVSVTGLAVTFVKPDAD